MKSAWYYIAEVSGEIFLLALIILIYYLSKEGPE